MVWHKARPPGSVLLLRLLLISVCTLLTAQQGEKAVPVHHQGSKMSMAGAEAAEVMRAESARANAAAATAAKDHDQLGQVDPTATGTSAGSSGSSTRTDEASQAGQQNSEAATAAQADAAPLEGQARTDAASDDSKPTLADAMFDEEVAADREQHEQHGKGLEVKDLGRGGKHGWDKGHHRKQGKGRDGVATAQASKTTTEALAAAQRRLQQADGQEHPSILDLQQWPHQDSLLEARSVFQDMLSKHVTPQTDLRPRGIVMPVGGTQLNANAFVSIQVMREVHGCLLPIDLVYYGADEMDVKTRKYFESRFPDVRVVDLATLPYPKHHNRVEVKDAIVRAYAFYHAGFDQVLMLHPDSTPLRDPTYLFDSREFQEAGNLFWPDFWQAMAGQPYVMPPAVFGLLDLPIPRPSDTDLWLSSTDSGQFLFDRKRLPDVLEWSFFVNALGPAFFYHMSQEKDSYHLAFSLAGKAGAFRQVLHMPRAVLAKRLRGKLNYLQVGSLQADPGGRPLFFHRSDGPGRLHPADASSDFLTADLVSIELSEGRALRMFHQPEDGGMGYGMGDVWVTNSTNSCAFDDGLNTQAKIHKECGAYITGTAAPFPVVPVHWFSETAQRTFQATYKALEQLRGEIAGGRLLQAACKRPGSPAGIQCMKPAR